MDGRCETCKWWTKNPPIEEDEPSGSGVCELTRILASGYKAHIGTKAVAEYEGDDILESWLNTRPDFGCVQWEPKDE